MTLKEREALLESQASMFGETVRTAAAIIIAGALIIGFLGWELAHYLNAAPTNNVRGFLLLLAGLG